MKKRVFFPLLVVILIIGTAATTYKSNFFEIAKQLEIFTDAYKQINMNYVDEVNPAELMDVAITAMFKHLDPYTVYWTSQQVEEARLKHAGNYTGIGANVQTLKDKIIIKQVYKGQPADKAGLKAGDELLKIGTVSISNFNSDAGELLKGAPGTTVKLTFERQGKIETTTLKRERVKKPLVPFYKLLDGDIGYIKLTQFGPTASMETKNALMALESQGAKKIILDLRGNPGGLLREAVNISNLFLPKGQLIVSTKSIVKKYNKTFVTQHQPVDTEIPVAVLVNSHSASASEIVSGSLQDLDRAVIVGSRSFGKGLVQRPENLKYGARMKLTISRYYTPSGRCIQALDYWHRDKNGKPVRATKADYKKYYTRDGRPVYDAGGIFPDVTVKTSEISGITQALLVKNAIFDFATKYYYSHDLKSPGDFKFTDADFKDFEDFLRKTDFHYETKMERQFQDAFIKAKDEGLRSKIKPEYEALSQAIQDAKAKELEDNKTQIEQQLTDEILKRYFYADGFYKYAVGHNPVIQKAKEVLNDQKHYREILSGPEK